MSEGSEDVATLLRDGVGQQHVANARCVVSVVEGPDVGASLEFDRSRPSRVLVGQSAACDLRLTDRLVSRRHFALDLDEIGIRLTDLGSTNGTFAGGLRVTDAHLAGAATIRVGETTLLVSLLPAGEPLALTPALRFGKMLGASPEMRRLYPLCERLAKTTLPVVIEGETGTGKEVLAESLHEQSPRAKQPFVVFDCTAFAPALVESILFGHERGSFTGAVEQRRGVFELAHGGTLFIDELGELDASLQPKLLRAVERGEVQRVGGNQWIPVDVRLIAATRRNTRSRGAGEGPFSRLIASTASRRSAPGSSSRPSRCSHRRHRDARAPLLARARRRRSPDAAGADDEPGLPLAIGRGTSASSSTPSPAPARSAISIEALGRAPVRAAAERCPRERASPGGYRGRRDPPLDRRPARARALVDRRAFERRYVAERVLARYDVQRVVRAAAASGIARRYFQLLRARQRRS